jgi:hypothetical protein
MPNRPIHIATSMPARVAYEFYKSNNQNDLARFLEALGGAVGGVLPDGIDPPMHSGHRSWGHGLAPVTTATVVWNQGLDGWQDVLRQRANYYAQLRMQATDLLSTAWHGFVEWVLRLLSGFVAGIGAGYVTHVGLDLGTPRCLPLIS